MKKINNYRSIFVSDMHLGSRGAQADALLNFLHYNRCEYLYCIGDVIDTWALKRRFYFPTSHLNVIRKILKRAAKGTKVFYTPGNHDEAVRDFIPMKLDNISVDNEFIHTTADGKKLLIIHGDCYDQVVQFASWLAYVGDIGYSLLLRSNILVNFVRRRFGYGYWSLSAYVKGRVKSAVSYIGEYERVVARDVRERAADGVVCGHIHCAEMREIDGILYYNDGDWVESRTAIVEHYDGRMEIVHWTGSEEIGADLDDEPEHDCDHGMRQITADPLKMKPESPVLS